MLVDDSIASIKILEGIFSDQQKFDIIAKASNGAEAVKLYQLHKPDLVILDIMMPVMDGLQALRIIMQLDRQAKVIMVSSMSGVGENTTEALKLGARGLISKPPNPIELIQLIEAS